MANLQLPHIPHHYRLIDLLNTIHNLSNCVNVIINLSHFTAHFGHRYHYASLSSALSTNPFVSLTPGIVLVGEEKGGVGKAGGSIILINRDMQSSNLIHMSKYTILNFDI